MNLYVAVVKYHIIMFNEIVLGPIRFVKVNNFSVISLRLCSVTISL